MGRLCDFCGDQRSMVFCRSDAACLCLSCDRNVHSANALSRRHSRTLVCERCNLHPAISRCAEEKISLCQNCDWIGHAGSTSASGHKRQTINCYSGCPSAAELSGIWSFISEVYSVDDSACEQGFGSMSLMEKSAANCLLPPVDNSNKDPSSAERSYDVRNKDKNGTWLASSSLAAMDTMPSAIDQPTGSLDSLTAKHIDVARLWLLEKLKPGKCSSCKQNRYPDKGDIPCCSGTKGVGHCDDDDFYEDFSMADMDMSLENYDELFGVSQNQSQHFLENGGMDSLFGDIPGADISTLCAYDAKDSSAARIRELQPACSNPVSLDSMISCKTDPNLCYPKQAQSSLSLSFSGPNGESSAGDYQDCGVSSTVLVGELPWHTPCPENQLPSASRDSAVLRYKEKKMKRKFDKKIRYASRKARADVRKRVKGRFIKAGEAYDYDPMCKTRSY
ncbi:hypothetical protein RJ639_013360 [Escallonia herrerae]|uniref:Zinc finger protein CONSTANS-LIKE 9 n=1 Tax=Escallonia herrerae TaxID=1293975 RepID=A0AA88VFY9_9ASTE|nr:hypothetical protein RJ639_013360 [Escallonia herrerae]